MGAFVRRFWLPFLLSEELAEPRRSAGPRAPARRRPHRVPRDRRQRRPGRRVLPAPSRADVLRSQRRVRSALRLSRLEIRRERRLRRHAVRTARQPLQDEGAASGRIRCATRTACCGPTSARPMRPASSRIWSGWTSRASTASWAAGCSAPTSCKRSKASSTPRTSARCTSRSSPIPSCRRRGLREVRARGHAPRPGRSASGPTGSPRPRVAAPTATAPTIERTSSCCRSAR